jgi:hypothetical protein
MEEGMILSMPELSEARIRRFSGAVEGPSPLADLDLFDPALRKQSDSPDQRHAHFFLGRSYFFASNWERARQELVLSLGQDGNDSRIVAWDLIYLGFIDFIQGRRESAQAHFLAARDLKIGGRASKAASKGLEMTESRTR